MTGFYPKNYTNDQLLPSKDAPNILFLPYEIVNAARPPTLFTRLYDYIRQRINREYTSDIKCKLFVVFYRLDDQHFGVLLMRMDNVSLGPVQGDLDFYYKPIDHLWRDFVGWPNPLELIIGDVRLTIPANPSAEILHIAVTGTLSAAAVPSQPNRDIPRKIFQLWNDSNLTDFPSIIQKSLATYRTLNPHYEHFSFGEDTARKYIAEHEPPHVLEAYNLLAPLAYKADLWRYVVLYHEGGVYADAKSIALAPLDVWLPAHGGALVNDIRGAGILNALMAMPLKDPLMRLAIDEIVRNVDARFYGESSLDITGPRLLARCLDHLGNDVSYTRLQFDNTGILIRDPSRNLVVASQHNGEYRRLLSRPGMANHYENFWLNRTVYGEESESTTNASSGDHSILDTLISRTSGFGAILAAVLTIGFLYYYSQRRRQTLGHVHQSRRVNYVFSLIG